MKRETRNAGSLASLHWDSRHLRAPKSRCRLDVGLRDKRQPRELEGLWHQGLVTVEPVDRVLDTKLTLKGRVLVDGAVQSSALNGGLDLLGVVTRNELDRLVAVAPRVLRPRVHLGSGCHDGLQFGARVL